MRIGVIGAGRAGSALAMALSGVGHPLVAATDLVPERAANLADALGAQVLLAAQVVRAAEVILLGVPDNAIAETAVALAPQLDGVRGKTFLHLSGAHSASLLQPLASNGAIGSFHPLLSIAEPRQGAVRLRSCFYGVEGEPDAVAVSRALVASLGGRLIPLRPMDKVCYHAAAVMASNYLVGLVDVALGLYESIGLDRESALQAAWPLIDATVLSVRDLGPEAALTGPIVRGDLATVEDHLAALGRGELLTLAVYRVLGRATVALAVRAGKIDHSQAKSLTAILGGLTDA